MMNNFPFDSLFMGKNGFVWWVGTVESNADPRGLGRCKVRILNWHNPDPLQIPTEALPWAYPIWPLDHFGESPIGPKRNTRIIGFFADGDSAQQPMMFGMVEGLVDHVTFDKLPYGGSPAWPIYDKLLGANPLLREGDCPTGDSGENTVTNETIVDPRVIKQKLIASSATASEWVLPATGFVASPYGPRAGGMHDGVDISPCGFYQQTDPGAPHCHDAMLGPVGNPVFAAAAGKVVYIFTNNIGQHGLPTRYDQDGTPTRSYGNAVIIQHHLSTGPYLTVYAHLGDHQDAAYSTPGEGILVKVGDTVTKGQQIGVMGRTHNRDMLTHLHFEIRVGTSLPKSNNHIPPGIIFPQLAHKHTAYLPNKYIKYTTAPQYDPKKAPVIALDPPAN